MKCAGIAEPGGKSTMSGAVTGALSAIGVVIGTGSDHPDMMPWTWDATGQPSLVHVMGYRTVSRPIGTAELTKSVLIASATPHQLPLSSWEQVCMPNGLEVLGCVRIAQKRIRWIRLIGPHECLGPRNSGHVI